MDLTDTIAPTSDQLDAVDLLAGPRTFTIERVSKGNAEQPVNIVLFGFPRLWRPGKSMRRVLVACWGPDASKYVGRRVTLYCDPEVRFGGQAVGGTRVSHLSHLDKPKSVPLLVSRGKSAMFIVRPLAETTKTRVADLKREWKTADAERREVIVAEVAALSGPTDNRPADSVGQQPVDDEPPAPTASPAQPPAAAEPANVTQAQLKAIHTLLTKCNVADRDEKLATLGRLIGRQIGSTSDLTKDEASAAINLLVTFTETTDPAAALQDHLLDVAQAEAQEANR